jgi:DHA1 family multidrug resistance protein-like MFS transporter
MLMGFVTLILMVFFMRETYPPTILVSKADSLRRRTKNWAIHAKQEEVEVDLREMLQKNFTRPLRMFFTEPILFVITIYLSFVYGLLYIFLTAYPLVFQGVHGFNPGVGGLPLFGMGLGMILAGIASALVQPAWRRKYRANKGKVVPEWRMPLNIVGGVVFTIGLFWFGWTGTISSMKQPANSSFLTIILTFMQVTTKVCTG